MVQKSRNAGARTEMVRQQEKIKEDLIKEGLKYAEDLKAEEAKLLEELSGLEAPDSFTALKVSFKIATPDGKGKQITLGPTGDLGPQDFTQYVQAIPRSVMAKVDGGRAKRAAAIKGRLRRMPSDYQRKKTDLETKIFHCDERIARYSLGGKSSG